MLDFTNPILWLLGIPAIGVLLFLLAGHFNAEARERRRRMRSHRPVVSRKPGPTVKFAVNTGKSKSRGKNPS
jgi:hypothetical protein